ncbi:RICIN domain-containing protein [Actinokineospora inagensis]|uniref:RICIN domain-containing protein n=1 Tax=Actinokineospora inagensis TaxID=103730 RepID=UPI0012F9152B|nr:RICIN domain-containing protein [Actinokineospora inagensis]
MKKTAMITAATAMTLFVVTPASADPGTYRLVSPAGGCVDSDTAMLGDCTADTSLWTVQSRQGLITVTANGNALTSVGDGAVATVPQDGTDAQAWTKAPFGPDRYTLTDANGDQLTNMGDGSLSVTTPSGGDDQVWELVSSPMG